MLTQEQIDHLADAALDAFNELDAELRARAGLEVLKLEAADVDKLRTELQLASRKSARDIEILIRDTLQSAAESSLAGDEKVYEAARVAGLVAPYAPVEESGVLNELLRSGVASAQSMANLVRTSAVEAVMSDFIDALDSAMLSVVAPDGVGVDAATRKAISKIIGNTSTVTYAQADGTVIEQGLYGAVRRAVATSANQTTARLTLARAREIGGAKFEVSAHLGARPEHAEWQGKVYTEEELYTVCGYGDGAGLAGWNCRHTFGLYFEGLSEPTDWSWADDPDGEQYELSQRQRESERYIRQYKGRANSFREVERGASDSAARTWAKAEKERNTALVRRWQTEADRVAGLRDGARRKAREVAGL